MCSINHELKAIYIHVPKCGGLSVQILLDKHYGFKTAYFTHENHSDYVLDKGDELQTIDTGQEKVQGFLRINKMGILRYFESSETHSEKATISPEQWKTYYKFTFVRNPYDRLVSAWKYINKLIEKTTNEKKDRPSFADFCKHPSRCDEYAFFHAFISQREQLLNTKGELNLQFIGKFENLNEDFIKVLTNLGVTKFKHKSFLINDVRVNKVAESDASTAIYPDLYTDELITLTNTYFADDFKEFGFSKCETHAELKTDSAKYLCSDADFQSRNIALVNRLMQEDRFVEVETQCQSTFSTETANCKRKEKSTVQSSINNRRADALLRALQAMSSLQTDGGTIK